MRLYNTLSRQIETFTPLQDNQVKLYTCGPTVYDYPHIGNLRSFVFDDTLRRALQAGGFQVRHVMNITDVGHLVGDQDEGEDKMEKGAVRDKNTVQQVAAMYTDVFLKDIKQLNILEPNGYQGPRGAYAYATDFIAEQIEIVKLLLPKGFAYRTEAAIYFDVSKLADYGKLTAQKLSEKTVAARAEVVADPKKRHPQDFAVWFFTVGRFADHSLRWETPWGPGFPGWHLECSAIIHATLGEPIDIHTGGVDHIGTHHTNEIAQTEAAFGGQLSKYWLHNEFLTVDGQKMSKSKGNFITLKEIEGKGYDPMALRLLFLQSHYRTQTNFTWSALDSAAGFLGNLQAWADLKFQKPPAVSTQQLKSIQQAVFDDLNTPRALALLADLGAPDQTALNLLDELLGLRLADRSDISVDQKNLIARRESARKNNDWTGADDLRKQLAETKLMINDSTDGPVWSRLPD